MNLKQTLNKIIREEVQKQIGKKRKLNEQRWTLGITESLFDKLEKLVAGQSDKGKIIGQFLKKNGLNETGSAYAINFLGGANPGKDEMSHPWDFLSYTPGSFEVDGNNLLVLKNASLKNLKVPDTLSFLKGGAKDDNFTFELKPGAAIIKIDYSFDLSSQTPTITLKHTMWSIPNQKWVPASGYKDRTEEVDDDFVNMSDDDAISFLKPMKMITLQQWVDQLNNAGWVKSDPEYFKKMVS